MLGETIKLMHIALTHTEPAYANCSDATYSVVVKAEIKFWATVNY